MNNPPTETRAFPLTHSFKMSHVAMIAELAELHKTSRSGILQQALEEKYEREIAKREAQS